MKPAFIKFTDAQGATTKTFTTCSLKTGLMDTIFDIAERAESFKSDTPDIQEVREFYREVKAVIVSAFGKQFTFDELNEGVETEELMSVFQTLCKNVMSGVRKN
ncbi:phage tail assembly chaperone G [Paenibacillus sp. sgz500958]|uniref:phage tail assembly chaperone G n=1 Tax=Paenibacillus sp. sgz500958 TaxID=3242475 RepID=UPI0036D2BDFF